MLHARLRRIVTCIGPNQKNQPNLDLYLVRRYKICPLPLVVSYLCIVQNLKNQPNLVLYLVRRSKIVVSVATLTVNNREMTPTLWNYSVCSLCTTNVNIVVVRVAFVLRMQLRSTRKESVSVCELASSVGDPFPPSPFPSFASASQILHKVPYFQPSLEIAFSLASFPKAESCTKPDVTFLTFSPNLHLKSLAY